MLIFNGTYHLLIPDTDKNYFMKMSGTGKNERNAITVEEVVSGNSGTLPIQVQLAVGTHRVVERQRETLHLHNSNTNQNAAAAVSPGEEERKRRATTLEPDAGAEPLESKKKQNYNYHYCEVYQG